MCLCMSQPADPHDDSAAADHRSAELGDARRAGAPAPTLPAPRGIATTRARCQDWSASPTPSSIHVPSTGGRHHRQVELIDSDSAVTFPIRRRRHHPAAQLNNLFGHAPHDRKDPIHTVSFGPTERDIGQAPMRVDADARARIGARAPLRAHRRTSRRCEPPGVERAQVPARPGCQISKLLRHVRQWLRRRAVAMWCCVPRPWRMRCSDFIPWRGYVLFGDFAHLRAESEEAAPKCAFGAV